MRIKRYEAKDSRTALARIKEELGEDAVILATKTLPSQRGNRAMVEVVAAIDYDIDNITVPPPGQLEKHINQTSIGDTYNLKSVNRKKLKQDKAATATLTAKDDSLSKTEFNRHGQIHSEAHDLRLRFASLLRPPKKQTTSEQQTAVHPIKRKLRPKKLSKPNPEEVAIWRNQLIDNIKFSQPKQYNMSGTPPIIALVGATGVGKTTTAAKLAAWYSLRQGRKVCLLSMDCYRIGATDQLRTYARIMRLPCEVVLRKPDLSRALKRHADKLIIIDTAGKSPYDEQHIPELQEWFSPFSEIAPHLVVSATTKKEDIQNVFRTYEPLNIASMVLTKLDETRAYAALCQQIATSALPISYLCTGQRVPEDFLLASKSFLDTLFKKGWPDAASYMEC